MAENIENTVEEQAIKDEHERFLMELFKENLNHMRHVESERILFVSLFLAFLGFVLATITQCGNSGVCKFIITISAIINLLCIGLICRWNKVFQEHRKITKAICKEILNNNHTKNIQKYYLLDFNTKLKPFRARYMLLGIYFATLLMLIVLFFLV
ncbi:MAG: hypothetical protein FWG61_09820 [Firmicutes bacterium]|nr:hypothetical protein [Bacillota bacterium]